MGDPPAVGCTVHYCMMLCSARSDLLALSTLGAHSFCVLVLGPYEAGLQQCTFHPNHASHPLHARSIPKRPHYSLLAGKKCLSQPERRVVVVVVERARQGGRQRRTSRVVAAVEEDAACCACALPLTL